MKSILLTLSIGLVLSAFLVGASPDSRAAIKNEQLLVAGNYKELILQIDDMNEKNVAQIRADIEANGGLVFKGYCKKLKVIMYAVDVNLHPDYSFLNTVFMNLSMGYLIKTGASITQVQIECEIDPQTIPSNPQD